jgi:hypothetical protein
MNTTEKSKELTLEELDLLKKEKYIDHFQQITMNNVYSRSKPLYDKLIWDNIDRADDTMIHYLNDKIVDTYRMKLNLIYNLLYSIEGLPITNKKDILKLFNIFAPLSNEFDLGSYRWSNKMVGDRLYIQNSVLKVDFTDHFKKFFLNPIKKLLVSSGVNFKFYNFKSTRFQRNIDLVFVFDL